MMKLLLALAASAALANAATAQVTDAQKAHLDATRAEQTRVQQAPASRPSTSDPGYQAPAAAQKSYSETDVRTAFRLGQILGAKQEGDRAADATMAEIAKAAPSIVPLLQAPAAKP